MKIGALVHMYPPLHNAGAEHMLHGLLASLVAHGHECVVCVSQGARWAPLDFEPYALDGVRVSEDEAALEGSDVLLTHLDRTRDAMAWTIARDVPLVHIVHNHLQLGANVATKCELAAYNSRWLFEAVRWPCPYVIVHPPVDPARYRTEPGGRVTLMNLTMAKGAELFYALARSLPDVEFLGVKGAYGVQVEPPELPNLEIWPTQDDARTVYRQTRVLLMPSTYESYGRCAVEAACSGIPTVASPTPGLREALGNAGTYAELALDAWERALRYVLDSWDECSERALAFASTLDVDADVDRFENALEIVVKRGC